MDNNINKEEEMSENINTRRKNEAVLSAVTSFGDKNILFTSKEVIRKEPPVKEKDEPGATDEELHENSVKLMSPGQMVARRFFRSKLSIIGLVMLAALFIFCFLGPLVYTNWNSTEIDENGKIEYTYSLVEYEKDGETYSFYQVTETGKSRNFLAEPDGSHPLGTDKNGMDMLTRLIYGGPFKMSVKRHLLSLQLLSVDGQLHLVAVAVHPDRDCLAFMSGQIPMRKDMQDRFVGPP